MEVEFAGDRPAQEKINEKLAVFELGEMIIQEIDDKGLVFRFKNIYFLFKTIGFIGVSKSQHNNFVTFLKSIRIRLLY